MMDIKNLEEKISIFLTSLPLSETERQSAEDFLSSRAGHEVLDSFVFENLASIPADSAIRLFRDLVKNGKKDTAAKLLLVLLAKGESTCYRMIPMEVIDPEKGAVDIETDAAKKAAVYAAILGADLYPLGSYSRDRLIDIACGKAEILKQAVQFEKNESDNGKFVLYAVYFMRKYKCGDGQENSVKEEDLALLAQYEEIAIENLDRIYPPFHLSVEEIKNAVRQGAVTEHILKLAGLKHGVSVRKLKLVASLAYLNYPLSNKLKDIIKICLAANADEALDAIDQIGLVSPMDIYIRGGIYDQEFDLLAKTYIRWSAKKGHTLILEKQLEDNQEIYLEAMEGMEINALNRMLVVIKRKNPALYATLIKNRKYYVQNKLIDKLLSRLSQGDPDTQIIRMYLGGQASVDMLYPFADKLGKNYYYSGSIEQRILRETDMANMDAVFYGRFQTYMWLGHGFWLLRNDLYENSFTSYSQISAVKITDMFQNFDCEGLDLIHQLSGISSMEEYFYGLDKEIFHSTVIQIFGKYLKERRKETLAAFTKGDAAERLLGLEILAQNAEENKKEILFYMEDGAKKVRQFLLEFLCDQPSWREEIEGMLTAKKSTVRELAIRVLSVWQESGMDCKELLTKALEKEKSAKLKGILQDMLNIQGHGASAGRSLSQKDLVQEIHKGGRRRSISWAYQTPFSVVHTISGEEAKEEYLQAIFLYYYSMADYGYNEKAELLAKALVADEFAIYVNELFDKWLAAGAEAKKRWVLYAAAIHGKNEIVERLKRQIKEWPKQARGAIACEAVQALSLNPLPQALLAVDKMARKFKYRQVRTAAERTLDFAAEQRGISREELADQIVPDLGFDEGMERIFDYGARKFRVAITPALEIEVLDEKGKKLKNLPSPGKKDDEKKAAAAYEEFKQMKKQMKEIVAGQKLRLEQALSLARLWSRDAWKQLFVKNPIMHQFAIGLIWGVYENGKLIQSFRYMEDGSFNTQDEEEYILFEEDANDKEIKKIGLVHPVELSEEDRNAWKQQLADYEITQPFLQLERPVFTLEKEELMQRKFSRFSGRVVNDMSLGSRLTGAGWYHGAVIDGGCFKNYYREDKEIGFGAVLHFSGGFIAYTNEDVTIENVEFYKLETVKTDDLQYGTSEKASLLKDVPEKYFSEIALQIERVSNF